MIEVPGMQNAIQGTNPQWKRPEIHSEFDVGRNPKKQGQTYGSTTPEERRWWEREFYPLREP